MTTYAFIDASNLFYGGEKSLGWKIDYKGLYQYLQKKYGVKKVYYFGGVETHGFPYNYQTEEKVSLDALKKHLVNLLDPKSAAKFNEAELLLIGRHLQKVKFYQYLENFGFILRLKPVKLYDQDEGVPKRKANCDVDMTLHIMKEINNYDRAIVLTGDGDFLPVLKHLREKKKEVLILARGPRTAREIRQFAGDKFLDFEYLKNMLSWK